MTDKALKNREKATSQLITRKKLHKIGKHWVAIGTMALLCLAGAYVLPNAAHASNVSNAQNGITLHRKTFQSNARQVHSAKSIKPVRSGIYFNKWASSTAQKQPVQPQQNIITKNDDTQTGIISQAQQMHRNVLRNNINNQNTLKTALVHQGSGISTQQKVVPRFSASSNRSSDGSILSSNDLNSNPWNNADARGVRQLNPNRKPDYNDGVWTQGTWDGATWKTYHNDVIVLSGQGTLTGTHNSSVKLPNKENDWKLMIAPSDYSNVNYDQDTDRPGANPGISFPGSDETSWSRSDGEGAFSAYQDTSDNNQSNDTTPYTDTESQVQSNKGVPPQHSFAWQLQTIDMTGAQPMHTCKQDVFANDKNLEYLTMGRLFAPRGSYVQPTNSSFSDVPNLWEVNGLSDKFTHGQKTPGGGNIILKPDGSDGSFTQDDGMNHFNHPPANSPAVTPGTANPHPDMPYPNPFADGNCLYDFKYYVGEIANVYLKDFTTGKTIGVPMNTGATVQNDGTGSLTLTGPIMPDSGYNTSKENRKPFPTQIKDHWNLVSQVLPKGYHIPKNFIPTTDNTLKHARIYIPIVGNDERVHVIYSDQHGNNLNGASDNNTIKPNGTNQNGNSGKSTDFASSAITKPEPYGYHVIPSDKSYSVQSSDTANPGNSRQKVPFKIAANSENIPIVLYFGDKSHTMSPVGNLSANNASTKDLYDGWVKNNIPAKYRLDPYKGNNMINMLKNYKVGTNLNSDGITGGGLNAATQANTNGSVNKIYVPVVPQSQPIHVKFVNEKNGQNVTNATNPDGTVTVKEDYGSSPSEYDIGEKVLSGNSSALQPGYDINNYATGKGQPNYYGNQNTYKILNGNNSVQTVYVVGKETGPATVHLIYKTNGHITSQNTASVPVQELSNNWRVSNKFTLNPNSWIKQGYTMDSTDHPQTITATANGASPAVVTYIYNAVPESVRVHFIDQNNKHLVGDSTVVNGSAYQTVKFWSDGAVENITIPKGYRFDTCRPDNLYSYEFSTDKNQNANIFVVGDEMTQRLQYLDQIGNIVGNANVKGQIGTSLDLTKNLPAGYRYDYTTNSGRRNLEYTSDNPPLYYVRVDGMDNLSQLKAKVVRDGMPTVEVPVGFKDKQNGNIAYANPDIMPTPGYTFDQKDSTGLTDNQLKANVQPSQVTWLNGEPVLYYHSVPQKLNINYVTPFGKSVGGTTLNGKTNQQLTLYDDKGLHYLNNIPAMYHYVPNSAYNTVKFTTGNPTVNVQVQSSPVHTHVTVYMEKDDYANGVKVDQRNVQRRIKIDGHVGERDFIKPSKFVPAGYQLSASDKPVSEQLISDGTGVSNPKVYFRYVNKAPSNIDINKLNVGQSTMYHGLKVTRLQSQYKYFRPVRGVYLYNDLPFTNKNKRMQINPQMNLTIPKYRVFNISSGKNHATVYEAASRAGDFFINGSPEDTENAYYQKNALMGHRIRITRNAYIYKSKHYSVGNRIKFLHPGAILSVKDVAFLGNPQHHQTRIYLGDGKWTTANKNFVSLV